MENNKFESRPWGYYVILDEAGYGKTKRIHVDPKQRLSYQSHEKRNEIWIVQQGIGKVTLNDEVQEIKPGSVIGIPIGCKHRVENTHDLVPLVFIEVQSGVYYGEDDIVRYDDDYGRKQKDV